MHVRLGPGCPYLTWSSSSPPFRPASTRSPGSPLKSGPRSSATSGPSPPLGPGFFHLPRPQGPGRLGPGHIEGRRGSQHPNRGKNWRMNQAAGQGWWGVGGECNIPQRSCCKPTEAAQDRSNLGSWPACRRNSHPPGWALRAQGPVLFSLSSLLLTESPKFLMSPGLTSHLCG